MAGPSIAELQQTAREAFGRELTEAEADAYRGRLPTMAQNIRRLRQWEERLRAAEPAQVQRVLEDECHA
jgi:transcription elongation GreA/GreB family factor